MYTRIAALDALKQAEQTEVGAFYFCMMAGVFAAFTVEAYLNHVGQKEMPDCWTDLERQLGPHQKLLLLRHVEGWNVNLSKRHFMTHRSMLKLRNGIAHGKTVTVDKDVILNRLPRDEDRWPEASWKKLCTVPTVKRMVQNAEAIVRYLHKLQGSFSDPFASPGHGSSTVRLIKGK